jgi:amidohydrolase
MSTIDRTSIRDVVADRLGDITAIRRDLHQHPELMFEEHRTSELVQRELRDAGVEFVAGLAKGTGVLAHLPATVGEPLPAIALRADMDALPIRETTGKPYASQHDGVMHACGHDGHTATLLGAAKVLAALPQRPRPVTFLFQPAEEGGAGGKFMVQDGALDGSRIGPPVTQIFGLHGWPFLPVGQVATCVGPMLAATDQFTIRVQGKGCHAALPHHGRDPVLAAAQIVNLAQSLAARGTDPLDSLVVSITTIHGGDAFNVIPDEVTMTGTMRTLVDETRRSTKARFLELIDATARGLGCTAEVEWVEGYPVTRNHPEAVERFRTVAGGALGEGRVVDFGKPIMGGEDFSFYCDVVPACFFALGLLRDGDDPEQVPQLHQSTFDFNDAALATGVEVFVQLAVQR